MVLGGSDGIFFEIDPSVIVPGDPRYQWILKSYESGSYYTMF
jgi:hypothetical protein